MTATDNTPEKLQAILDRYVSQALEDGEAQKASTPGPFHAGFPEGHAVVLRTLEAKTKDALALNSIRFFEPTVDTLLEQHGIALEKDSPEYRSFTLKVMQREIEAARIGQARAIGDYSDQYAMMSLAPTPMVQPIAQVPAHLQSSPVKLCVGIAKYIKVLMGTWSEKTLEKNLTALEEFYELVGDKPLASLVRDDVREYCRVVHRLPKRRTRVKPYKGKTIQQILSMSIPGSDLLTSGTIDDRFVTVSVLLNWLADEYPMTLPHLGQLKKELVVSRKAPTPEKRRAYSEEELRLLFEPTAYTSRKMKKSWQYWLPLLGLLTGARLGELCQLLVTDIKQDDASGVWYFDINDMEEGKRLKTKAAKRHIPMHPALVELGLLQRVQMLQRRKEPHLFPGLFLYADPKNPAKAPSKWFSDFRWARGVGAGSGEVSPLTYHSLRHTFITQCKHQRLDRIAVKEIVGHEPGESDDTTSGYEGAERLHALYDAVMTKLDFREVLDFKRLKLTKWQETL